MSRPFSQSLRHAMSGLRSAWKTQQNVRIHSVIAVSVLLLAVITGMSALEVAIVLVTISIVIVSELINTAVEILSDIMHPRVHRNVEILKDVSAAAVLVASVVAVLVGVLLFFV